MFWTVPLPIIRSFSLYTQQWYKSHRFADSLRAGSEWNCVPSWSCSQAVSKPVWFIPLLCVQWKTPDDGQRNCPKYVEFHSKNKLEKLVHLVGFFIRKMITVHSANYCMCNTCTRCVAQTISPILQHVITNNWLFRPWTITWNYLYTPPPHTHTHTVKLITYGGWMTSYMSFGGCISKLVVYPTGFAWEWRIVTVVAGLTGAMDQCSTLDMSLCLMLKLANSLTVTHEVWVRTVQYF